MQKNKSKYCYKNHTLSQTQYTLTKTRQSYQESREA